MYARPLRWALMTTCHRYHARPRGIFRDIILIQRSENGTYRSSFHRIHVNHLELTEVYTLLIVEKQFGHHANEMRVRITETGSEAEIDSIPP